MRQPKAVALVRLIAYSANLLLLGSLTVGFSPNDNDETNVSVTGDVGQYADIHRGCDGSVNQKHEIPIREISASLNHKPSRSWRVGIDGSLIYSKEEQYCFDPEQYRSFSRYASRQVTAFHPYIGVDGTHIGAGVGYLWASGYLPYSASGVWPGRHDFRRTPTGSLRIGNPHTLYFDVSAFHTMPLSGGYFRVGFGSNRHPRSNWWVGMSVAPYDKLGVALRTRTQLQPKLYLDALVRAGASEGMPEGVLGLGVTYRLGGR
jgi:hypothetical protein